MLVDVIGLQNEQGIVESFYLTNFNCFLFSVLGAFLVVLGLYATLWGKKKDKEKKSSMDHGISQQANEINLENKKENEIH